MKEQLKNYPPLERLRIYLESKPEVIDTDLLMQFALALEGIAMDGLVEIRDYFATAHPEAPEEWIGKDMALLSEQLFQSMSIHYSIDMNASPMDMQEYTDNSSMLDWMIRMYDVEIEPNGQPRITAARLALERIFLYAFSAGFGFAKYGETYIAINQPGGSLALHLPDVAQTSSMPDPAQPQPGGSSE